MVPPLPPTILTQILSHLLPPVLPLPHHLLAKPILQRLLYLPPDEDDRDGQINPLPAFGVTAELDRLAAVGFEPVPVTPVDDVCSNHKEEQEQEKGKAGMVVQYASDGEGVFARVRLRAIGEADNDGLEIKFSYEVDGSAPAPQGEPRADARGWTYLSCLTMPTSLKWTTDPSSISLPSAQDSGAGTSQIGQDAEDHIYRDGTGSSTDPSTQTETGYYPNPSSMTHENTAPADYWADFSPPSSAHLEVDTDGNGENDGEDDYWAQYNSTYTPAAEGSRTPALQAESVPIENENDRNVGRIQDLGMPTVEKGDQGTHGINGTTLTSDHIPEADVIVNSSAPAQRAEHPSPPSSIGTRTASPLSRPDDLLRSRMSMKISSILRRTWLEFVDSSSSDGYYAEEGDREVKAMRWLAIGKERTLSASHVNGNHSRNEGGSALYFGRPGSSAQGGDGDAVIKAKLSILREMYDLIDDPQYCAGGEGGSKQGGEDGFYRLVEGAMRGVGVGAGGGDGGEDRGGIRRVDSTAQVDYWE